jgi:hypothetical protein
MEIIAFGYKKGSGKNTIAKFLSTHIRCTHPGLKVTEVSFAAKVKDISYQLYGWLGLKRGIYYETHRDEKERPLELITLSPRQIWIGVGNKLREIYPDTWINYALNSVKGDIIIITDLGFINEAKAIRNQNGKLIKIIREGIPTGTDARETELDNWADWDSIIKNSGSLDNLYNESVLLWSKIENEQI